MAKNAEKKAAAQAKYWSEILMVMLICLNSAYFFRTLGDIKTREYEWYYSDVIWVIIYAWVERKTYN